MEHCLYNYILIDLTMYETVKYDWLILNIIRLQQQKLSFY